MSITSSKVQEAPPKKTPDEPKPKIDLAAKVERQVLERLGRPDNLHHITAGNVGGTNFRVNVWTTVQMDEKTRRIKDLATLTETVIIGHSFYVRANDNGEIVSSSPEIKRQYGDTTKSRKPDPQVNVSSNAAKATSTVTAPKPATS